jgi:hypothetical protein
MLKNAKSKKCACRWSHPDASGRAVDFDHWRLGVPASLIVPAKDEAALLVMTQTWKQRPLKRYKRNRLRARCPAACGPLVARRGHATQPCRRVRGANLDRICVSVSSLITMRQTARLECSAYFDRSIANGRFASVCIEQLEMPSLAPHHSHQR